MNSIDPSVSPPFGTGGEWAATVGTESDLESSPWRTRMAHKIHLVVFPLNLHGEKVSSLCNSNSHVKASEAAAGHQRIRY